MNPLVVAALAFELEANQSKIQLFPAYDFKATDGRPHDVERWKINASIAAKIIKKANQQQDKLLIDYEHQTLVSAKNGQASLAAGWFKNLEWIEGLGLFSTGVEWTKKAKQFIKNREYRYISPVLTYDKQTGEVTGLLMAALVNYPAIDGMKDVSQSIAAKALHTTVNQLTEGELRVCMLMGASKGDFMATKRLDQAEQSVSALKNSQGLTESEISVCLQLGIEASEYEATKKENNNY